MTLKLKKNINWVYFLCFLAVIAPGIFVLLGPKLKTRSEEQTNNRISTIILIGSFPFLIFCIMSLAEYICKKRIKI